MVFPERCEKVAVDTRAEYREGTVVRVKWPNVDGTKGWHTAFISAVSERQKPRRLRLTPSYYKYSLFWGDGSKVLTSRLLHVKHKVLYRPPTKQLNIGNILHCHGQKYQLPIGINYAMTRMKGLEREMPKLQIWFSAVGKKSRFSQVGLKQYPSLRPALDKAIAKRFLMILEHLRTEKKAAKKIQGLAVEAQSGAAALAMTNEEEEGSGV
ncbi:unnamed protein product [Amoebophrya sp. A25]|nr:unnamed protein product [Amoebophrya sp. A25]|eukprot:GSA25T00008912001.1